MLRTLNRDCGLRTAEIQRWALAAGSCSLAALLFTSCASAPAATRPVATTPATARVDSVALPPLAVDQLSEGGVTAQRIRHFDAHNQDVRLVVRALAENFGLGYQIDQDVRGHVNTRLENATLEQALASVLGPLGYSFQLDGGVIRVSGTRLQTRIFTLDYVSLSRIGTTTTVSTRRIGGGGSGQSPFGGGQFGGSGGGAGGESIHSVTAADLWAGIRVALEAIVFDSPAPIQPPAGAAPRDTTDRPAAATTPTTTTTPPAPAPIVAPVAPGSQIPGTGLNVGGTAATARSGEGKQLVIDPLAGTIMVTAPPATLARVEAYINTVQTAVQRQVLIEAKIVEVELRREFRFGIDWRTLAQNARLGIEFLGGVTAGNAVQLRLGGGSSQVQVALRALETQGDVTVLASPMISALNNQPAQFDATTDEVFFSVTQTPVIGPNGQVLTLNTQAVPQQISVGIVLNVLAQIGADNTITMLIRPGLSDVLGMREQVLPDGGTVSAPVITRRDADTMARVRNGETIIIGGLTRTRRERSRSGVPGLQNIPVIGGAFSSREDVDLKNEIVIFLTPTVIVGQPNTAAR